VGIFEIVHRNNSGRQVVLADEGTLHIAHYLFVHVSVEPDLSSLETFTRLVSKPDVVIYIRQPESVLINRISKRGHKRILKDSPAQINQFVKHGVTVFDELVACSNLGGRLLIVDGGDGIKPIKEYPNKPGLDLARKIIDIKIDPLSTENSRPIIFDLGR
jgi:thymidylate kinase